MIITEVTAITKSRYRVVLDEEFTFALYKGELRRFHMKQGEELTEDAYQSILHEILPKRAKLRCMNLLQTKDYTRKQLEDKLRQGDYPAEVIDEAIAYVESYGYINDETYARNYIECNMQKKSRMCIENDLLRKGVSKELIHKVFEKLDEDGTGIDESVLICRLLSKKNYHASTATSEEKRKMYGFLYRKGFHADAISKAMLLDIT